MTLQSLAASSAKGVCVLRAVHHSIISPDIYLEPFLEKRFTGIRGICQKTLYLEQLGEK